MGNWSLRKMRDGRGFTLIELLLVVAIIAILAAVLIPNFLRARAQSQVAASKSNLKSLGAALEIYLIDDKQYPIGSGNASQLPDRPGVAYAAPQTVRSGGVLLVLVPNYLRAIPLDPCSGRPYRYDSTDGTTYSLTIDFPQGNICDWLVGTRGDSVDLTYTPNGGLKEGP